MFQFFIILIILVVLNIIPLSFSRRQKFILPLSFFIMFIFLGIRYNYGLDYATYKDYFYNPFSRDREFSEFLFWQVFYSFSNYYTFVLFHTLLWCVTLFYFVRKYIPPKYYWLFFVVFFLNNNLMFNFMSALRSSLATCVFLWSTEFFYLRKNSPLFFCLCIIIASFFHTSALFMLIIPLFEIFRNRIGSKSKIILSILCLFMGLFYTSQIAQFLLSSIGERVDGYNGYIDQDMMRNSSVRAMFLNMLVFLPICVVLEYSKNNLCEIKSKFIFLSFLWFIIFALHMDFHGRISMFLYLFFFIAIVDFLSYNKRKWLNMMLIFSIVSYACIRYYATYKALNMNLTHIGNMLQYQTIFEVI